MPGENSFQLRYYESVMDSILSGTLALNSELVIASMNPAAEHILGFKMQECIGFPLQRLLDPVLGSDGAQRLAAGLKAVLRDRFSLSHELVIANRIIELKASPLVDSQEAVMGVVLVLEDITERKQAEAALAEERNLLRTLIDNLPDFVYAKDTQGRYVLKNLADGRLMDAASPAEVVGKTDYDCYPPEVAARFAAGDPAVIRSGQPLIDQEELITTATGSQRWLLTTKAPWRDHQGQIVGLVGICHDITERKAAEEMLRNLSLTDDLTGLYNRRGFLALAEQQLKLARRMKQSALLLFGDMDKVKTINDTWGHPQGDLAIIEIATVLKETSRESDIVARLGGDEFAVLALEAPESSAQTMVTRLMENLEAHNARGDRYYKLTFSVGIARYDPEAPCSVTDLIKQADSSMYQQKQGKI